MLKKITIGFLALLAVLAAGIVLFAKDIEIRVSEADAQAAIDQFMSAGNQEHFGITIVPNSLQIEFKANDRAKITTQTSLKGFGYSGEFDGVFMSGIDYRPTTLYLQDADLLRGGFSADETVTSELADMKKVAVNVLKRQREKLSEETGEAIDNSVEKNTDLVEIHAENAVRNFVQNLPIYDVSKAGKYGMAAGLALKDVRFDENEAIVTLSPVTALLRVLGMLGLVLLAGLWFYANFLMRFMGLRNQAPKD